MAKMKLLSSIPLTLCLIAATVCCGMGCSPNPSTIAQTLGTSPPPTPTNPGRTEPNPASDFIYTIGGNNVTITGYVGVDGDVVIPEKIDGKNVTFIDDLAFCRCERLTTIKIPNGVTHIGGLASTDLFAEGWGAFSGCCNLASVTIPNSVTIIGDDAFGGCQSLTSITLPSNLRSIGKRAFGGCVKLTSVTIPNGVTSIGFRAFSSCVRLISIIIPDSVTTIGNNAFGDFHDDIIVSCSRDSYAYQYCVDNNIKVLIYVDY